MNDAKSNDATLHRLAASIGEQAAARLDVERAAQGVLRRLRERPVVEQPRWVRTPWLAAAAALVVLLGGGLVARGVIRHGGADHYVAEDLTELSTDDLRQILASLEETLTSSPSPVSDTGLEDLNEQQLREVLRSLEG